MRSIQAFSPTRRWLLSAAAGVGALAVQVGATDTRAQEVEAFYKGKTINLMVATSAGGNYDLNARLVSRHLGRFIPGNPPVNPSNSFCIAGRLYG